MGKKNENIIEVHIETIKLSFDFLYIEITYRVFHKHT